MGLFCILWQRALARYAVLESALPRGSRIEAHVDRCAECRAYLDDLHRLSKTLTLGIVAPQAPAISLMPNEDWLAAHRPESKRRLAPALALACTALVIGSYVWSRVHPGAYVADPNVTMDTRPTRGYKAIPLDIGAPSVKVASGKHRRRHRRHRIRSAEWAAVAAPHRRYVRHKPSGDVRSIDPEGLASVQLPVEHSRAASACAWQTAGAELEAAGETQMAETAYRLANAEMPSANYALDVGRSAEKNGKLEQALDCYADLLEASSDPALHETASETKGITP